MSKRVAYSCFVDSKPKFEKEVVRWVWSLVEVLGVPSEDVFLTCDPGISEELKQTLSNFPAINLLYRKCFTEISRPANKWLQLEALQESLPSEYSHVVLSDCDKVFVEFSEEWCDDSVRACKFIPRPTFSIFEEIFDLYFQSPPRFTIERPDGHDPTKDNRSYVNNHNGGLVIIPREKLELITTSWKYWIDTLLGRMELLKANGRNLDQVALALVMHEIGSDIKFLPQTLDLGPNISAVSPHVLAQGSGQLILHVHGFDDDMGRIKCGENVPENFRLYVKNINSRYVQWQEKCVSDSHARDFG